MMAIGNIRPMISFIRIRAGSHITATIRDAGMITGIRMITGILTGMDMAMAAASGRRQPAHQNHGTTQDIEIIGPENMIHGHQD